MNEMKNIKISDLLSVPDNSFKITLDAEMERLIKSFAKTDIIAPIIASQTENSKYEIVSGHSRKYAQLSGLVCCPHCGKRLLSFGKRYTGCADYADADHCGTHLYYR